MSVECTPDLNSALCWNALVMQEGCQISTGLHLCVVDKVTNTEDALKKIVQTLEQYGATYQGTWRLGIDQYRIKSEFASSVKHKELSSDVISLCTSTSFPQNVLVCGKYASVIADLGMTMLFSEYFRFYECTHSIVVQGHFYRLNDFIIRYGSIQKAEEDLHQVVLDFEYLVSGHPRSLSLLQELHRVIYPYGKYVLTSFLNYANCTLPLSSSSALFSFSDLGFMYAGIAGMHFDTASNRKVKPKTENE